MTATVAATCQEPRAFAVAGDHPEVHVLVDESAVDPRDQRRLVAWRPAVAYLVALLTIAPAALCALRDAW